MASSHQNGECSYTQSSNQEETDLEKSVRMGYEEINEIVNRSLQSIKAIGRTKIDGTEVIPENRVDAARRGVDAAGHDPPRSVVLDIYAEVNEREANAGLITRSGEVPEIHQNPRVENATGFRPVQEILVENVNATTGSHISSETLVGGNPTLGNAAGTGFQAPTGGEPTSVRPARKTQYWTDSVNVLRTATAAAAFASTVMCAGFTIYGSKALSDSDDCDGPTAVSVKVVSFALSAMSIFWVSLFLTVPTMIMIQGFADNDLAEKTTRRRIKRSVIFNIAVVMVAVICMGLAIFYFIQARLGAWQCTSSGTRALLMFVALAMCFMEFLLFGIIFYINKV